MKRIALATAFLACLSAQASAQQYYVSEIITLATYFCPVGTLPADGRTLPISQNTPLFSLIGTNYGGNGTTTFQLPNVKPVLTASRYPLIACIATTGIFPARN